jgi:hypothetical protein
MATSHFRFLSSCIFVCRLLSFSSSPGCCLIRAGLSTRLPATPGGPHAAWRFRCIAVGPVHRQCRCKPVLPNDTAPPLLRLPLSALVTLVDRAIRCGSIPHAGPRVRRHFVRSSSRADEIAVLLLLRSSLIVYPPTRQTVMARRSTATQWSGRGTSSSPPCHPPTISSSSLLLLVAVCRLATDKTDGDSGGGRRHTTDAHLTAVDCCPPSASSLHGQSEVGPPPANEVSLSSRLHVIIVAAHAKIAGLARCDTITAGQGHHHHH